MDRRANTEAKDNDRDRAERAVMAILVWLFGIWLTVVVGCLAFLAVYGFFAFLFSLFSRETWSRFWAFVVSEWRVAPRIRRWVAASFWGAAGIVSFSLWVFVN